MLILLADGWTEESHDRTVGLGPIADRLAAEMPRAACMLVSCAGDGSTIARIVQAHSLHAGEPLVLVGYSYGGSLMIDACWKLAALGIAIDQLVTLDPVPRWGRGQWQNFPLFGCGNFGLPTNVRAATCLYKSQGSLHGLPLRLPVQKLIYRAPADPLFLNDCVDRLQLGHGDLPYNDYVRGRIFDLIAGAAGGGAAANDQGSMANDQGGGGGETTTAGAPPTNTGTTGGST